MNTKNQPAFPVEVSVDENGNLRGSQTSNFSGFEIGLTKREYFAGKALQGLLSIYDDNEQNPTVPNEDNVKYMAKLAVKAADILLAELSIEYGK